MRKRVKLEAPDAYLLGITLFLVAVGVLLVFDASYAKSGDIRTYGFDTWYFAKRQLAYACLGLFLMFCISAVPLATFRKFTLPFLTCVIPMLIVVLIPHLGSKSHGARSWFRLGPLSMQPAELAKLAIVLYLANALAGAKAFSKKTRRWVRPFMLTLGVAGLIVLERDLGMAVLLCLIVFAMFYGAGAKKRYLVAAGLCGLAMAMVLIFGQAYSKTRIGAFTDHGERATIRVTRLSTP